MTLFEWLGLCYCINVKFGHYAAHIYCIKSQSLQFSVRTRVQYVTRDTRDLLTVAYSNMLYLRKTDVVVYSLNFPFSIDLVCDLSEHIYSVCAFANLRMCLDTLNNLGLNKMQQ